MIEKCLQPIVVGNDKEIENLNNVIGADLPRGGLVSLCRSVKTLSLVSNVAVAKRTEE